MMGVNLTAYNQLRAETEAHNARLVAVSKMKPVQDIRALYNAGQRIFGENYVQELVDKAPQLPADIQWHFIGHLQTNKVKYIAPFVAMIHGVDSLKLLQEIGKQAVKNDRVIDCLLQVHIAREETKFGLDEEELRALMPEALKVQGVRMAGLMGMASNTDDENIIRSEFHRLVQLHAAIKPQDDFCELSMGMSGDYRIALEEGSTLIRIGSLLFGARNYASKH